MSPAFKGIVNVGVWVLFLVGLAALAVAFVRIVGGGIGGKAPELATMTAYFGYGMAGIFLSVVAIAITRKRE